MFIDIQYANLNSNFFWATQNFSIKDDHLHLHQWLFRSSATPQNMYSKRKKQNK